MVHSTKNTKEAKDPLPMAKVLPCATIDGNREYLLEPPNTKENLHIYKPQVPTPYTLSEITHALICPMREPSEDLTKIRYFPPAYHRKKRLVSIKGPMNLEYMTTTLRVFRLAFPTKKA